MNKKAQEQFKKLLLAKRADLLEVVRSKKETDLRDVEIGDEIDSASQNIEKEMLFELADNEKQMLDAIESALRRIEKGSFGLCESCRAEIADKRINAIPWVRYCMPCQTKAEKPK